MLGITPSVQSPSAWGTRATLSNRIHPQTAFETTVGASLADKAYAPGDPRRSSVYENLGLKDLGVTPIYVDSDTFKVTGDVTSLFPVRTRIAMVGTTRNYGQVLTATFSAGETTIEMRMDHAGNIPADIAAVWAYSLPQLDKVNTFMIDINQPRGLQIINKNAGVTAATHVLIGNFTDSGIVIVSTQANYVGAYLSGAPGNPASFIHTGLPIPIVIGTNDVARMIFDGAGAGIQCIQDFIIQNGATAKLVLDGTVTGYASFKVSSVEQAVITCTTASMVIGTVVAASVGFYTNGAKRLGIAAAGVGNYANDAAAAAASVAVGDIYRNGSVLMVRVS